jgi:hypothetical protein
VQDSTYFTSGHGCVLGSGGSGGHVQDKSRTCPGHFQLSEKVRYFCTYLTKKSGLAQLTFFNCSLGDLEVSFVIKYQYLICRA